MLAKALAAAPDGLSIPAAAGKQDLVLTTAYAAGPPAVDGTAFTMESENIMALTYAGDLMQYRPTRAVRFLAFLTRRLAFLLPQLLAVSVIVFFMLRLLPGDPSYIIAGPYATKERIAEVRAEMQLDRPLVEQYVLYMDRVLHGNFGTSWRTSRPVLVDIEQRFPATLELVLGAGFFSIVIGVPLGAYLAAHRGSAVDRIARVAV